MKQRSFLLYAFSITHMRYFSLNKRIGDDSLAFISDIVIALN